MKKWVRNLIIGIVLNTIKNSSFGQKILGSLRDKKTIVGRTGLGIFTIIGIVKYYNPTLPIDDGLEVLGIVFSWLALELGLNSKINPEDLLNYDPSKPVDINIGTLEVHVPPTEDLSNENTISTEENVISNEESEDSDNR